MRAICIFLLPALFRHVKCRLQNETTWVQWPWPRNRIIPPFVPHLLSRDSKSTCSISITGRLSGIAKGNCLCIGHSNLSQNISRCSPYSHFLSYYYQPLGLTSNFMSLFLVSISLFLHIPFLQRLMGRIDITRCALCDFSF